MAARQAVCDSPHAARPGSGRHRHETLPPNGADNAVDPLRHRDGGVQLQEHASCAIPLPPAASLDVGGQTYAYASLPLLGRRFALSRLPYSMKILLENLLRHEDGVSVLPEHIEAVAKWDPKAEPDTEIAFMPARVVLQDFTGVPCVVDLAAMRDAVVKLGGRPEQINPQIPSELVIDHSIQVDVFGRADALDINGRIEFERNRNATPSCAGARRRSPTSRWCRPTPASSTR